MIKLGSPKKASRLLRGGLMMERPTKLSNPIVNPRVHNTIRQVWRVKVHRRVDEPHVFCDNVHWSSRAYERNDTAGPLLHDSARDFEYYRFRANYSRKIIDMLIVLQGIWDYYDDTISAGAERSANWEAEFLFYTTHRTWKYIQELGKDAWSERHSALSQIYRVLFGYYARKVAGVWCAGGDPIRH